jgi:hypothetical protein
MLGAGVVGLRLGLTQGWELWLRNENEWFFFCF